MKKDRLIQGLMANGMVQFYGIDGKRMVTEAKKIHNTSATCTAALGRSLMGTAMMTTMEKGKEDKVTLIFRGDGPAGNIVCVGRKGENGPLVKGSIAHPEVELPARPDGKLDVGGAVGHNGTLTVIRDLGLKEPYGGSSDLASGEIADDITKYFASSQQTPSIVSLGVHIGKDFEVAASGGVIVQLMPGCDDTTISTLETCAEQLPSLVQAMEEGESIQEAVKRIFAPLHPEILEEHETEYRCDCSRERIERALLAIGETEFRQLIEEDNGAELSCHFCNKKYYFTREELEKLLAEAKAEDADEQ